MTDTFASTDPSLQILQQAFWERHQHLAETERHQLWNERKDQLASLMLDTGHGLGRHSRIATTPRTVFYGDEHACNRHPPV